MSKTIALFSGKIKPKDFKNNKYKFLKKEETLKKKFIDVIFINRSYSTLNKTQKEELYKIKTDYLSAIDIIGINFTDKSLLNKYIKLKDKKFHKKYFMNQYDYKDIDQLKKNIYIAKPIPGYHGFGIKVFNDNKNIKEYIDNFKIPPNKKYMKKPKKWIIEEYIKNPLLINSKKFHLRLMLLLTCENNKIEYRYYNKLQIISSLENFTLEKLNFNIHNTHKKDTTIKYFPEYFTEIFGESKTKKVKKEINTLFKGLVELDLFKFKCYENSKNCFELFGVDLIITDKYKVKLLEINEKPGFKDYSKTGLFSNLLTYIATNKNKSKNYTEI